MGVPEFAETWHRLELTTNQHICFVLDASDLGVKSQNAALQLLANLRDQMPGFNQHTVTFLGGGQHHSAGALINDGAKLFLNNRNRLGTIAPVYESVGTDVRFVILAASSIFDLSDWLNTPQFQRSVFVNLGTGRPTDGLAPELPPDASRLAEFSTSPLISVKILAGSRVPFSWDNPAFHIDEANNLLARNAEKFTVTFALAGTEGEVNAECIFDNGQQQLIKAANLDPPATDRVWRPFIEKQEAEIAKECINNGQFHCPHCGKTHQRQQLSCCLRGQFIATSVFTSIASITDNCFAMIRPSDSGQVSYCSISNPVLPLNSSEVAVFRSGEVIVMKYNAKETRWQESGTRFEQFSFIERWGAYAICVR